MTRTTLYGTLTQDEKLNENEKAILYIKECAELVGLEVIEDKTAFSITFMAEIMKRLREEPKTGKWIDDKCSICGKGIKDLIDSREWYTNETPNYCPNCGAKMSENPTGSESEGV